MGGLLIFWKLFITRSIIGPAVLVPMPMTNNLPIAVYQQYSCPIHRCRADVLPLAGLVRGDDDTGYLMCSVDGWLATKAMWIITWLPANCLHHRLHDFVGHIFGSRSGFVALSNRSINSARSVMGHHCDMTLLSTRCRCGTFITTRSEEYKNSTSIFYVREVEFMHKTAITTHHSITLALRLYPFIVFGDCVPSALHRLLAGHFRTMLKLEIASSRSEKLSLSRHN